MWVLYGRVLIYPCKTESLVSEPAYEDSGVDIIAYKHTITVVGYVNMSMLSILEDKIQFRGGEYGYNNQSTQYALDNTPVSTFSTSREQDFNFNQTISAISRYLLTPRRRLYIGATTPPSDVLTKDPNDLYEHKDIVFVSPESKSPNIIDPYGGPIPTRSSVESIVHNNFAKVRWSCTWYSDPRRYKPAQHNFDIYTQPALHDPIASHRYSIDINTNEHGLSTVQITAVLTLNPGYYIDQRVYEDFKVSKHATVIPTYILPRKIIPNINMFRRTGTSLNISQDGRKATITITLQEVPYFYKDQDKYGINHIDVNVRVSSEIPEASSTYLTTVEAIYKAYIAPYAHPHDVCIYLQRILNYGLVLLRYRLKNEAIKDFQMHLLPGTTDAFVNKRLQNWPTHILLRGTHIDYDYSGLTCTLRASIAIFTNAITYLFIKGNKDEPAFYGDMHLSYLFGLSIVRTTVQLLKSAASDIKVFLEDPYFSERQRDTYIGRSIEQSMALIREFNSFDSRDDWTNSHARGIQFPKVSHLESVIIGREGSRRLTNEYINPLGDQMKIFLCPISYHNVSSNDDREKFESPQLVLPRVTEKQIILLQD
jgi:hypothetical protein